jgi:hypothetical protein
MLRICLRRPGIVAHPIKHGVIPRNCRNRAHPLPGFSDVQNTLPTFLVDAVLWSLADASAGIAPLTNRHFFGATLPEVLAICGSRVACRSIINGDWEHAPCGQRAIPDDDWRENDPRALSRRGARARLICWPDRCKSTSSKPSKYIRTGQLRPLAVA